MQAGVIGILRSNTIILDVVESIVKDYEKGIWFLTKSDLIDHCSSRKHQKQKISIATSSETNFDMIRALFTWAEETKQNQAKVEPKWYVIFDLTNLHPEHYREILGLLTWGKEFGCLCFILGAETLLHNPVPDFKIDEWLFPDAALFFTDTENQQLLQTWGMHMKMEEYKFQALIALMNEQKETCGITAWNPIEKQLYAMRYKFDPETQAQSKETENKETESKETENKETERKETESKEAKEADSWLDEEIDNDAPVVHAAKHAEIPQEQKPQRKRCWLCCGR